MEKSSVLQNIYHFFEERRKLRRRSGAHFLGQVPDDPLLGGKSIAVYGERAKLS